MKNIKTFIKKNKLFSALIVMAIIIALVAIFAPVLAPYSPYDAELSNAFQAPSSEHLFGTDKLGSCLLYTSQLRVLKQARLVKFRKEGKTVFYSLDDDHITKIFDYGLHHIEEMYKR